MLDKDRGQDDDSIAQFSHKGRGFSQWVLLYRRLIRLAWNTYFNNAFKLQQRFNYLNTKPYLNYT